MFPELRTHACVTHTAAGDQVDEGQDSDSDNRIEKRKTERLRQLTLNSQNNHHFCLKSGLRIQRKRSNCKPDQGIGILEKQNFSARPYETGGAPLSPKWRFDACSPEDRRTTYHIQLATSKGLAFPYEYICTTKSLVRARHDYK